MEDGNTSGDLKNSGCLNGFKKIMDGGLILIKTILKQREIRDLL